MTEPIKNLKKRLDEEPELEANLLVTEKKRPLKRLGGDKSSFAYVWCNKCGINEMTIEEEIRCRKLGHIRRSVAIA